MPLNPEQLPRALERGLAPVYLLTGDEPLLIDECAELVRARARAMGYNERSVHVVGAGFDWEALIQATRSLSLFAERRVVELRLPTGKPGETGAAAITAFAENPPPDMLLLVLAGKLDKGNRDSAWVQAIESAGAMVTIWPLDVQRLPGWIAQRLSARGLKPEAGVVDLLVWHLEGNLLAAAQEVDKLAMLHGGGVVTLADVEASLADSTRFSVYQLVDAALGGDAAGVRRIFQSLRADGTEPILMLWALARELRTLTQMSQEIRRGKPEGTVLGRVWQNRRTLTGKALKRLPTAVWFNLMRRTARLDRVVKGQAPGDRWLEAERLLLAVAGLKPMIAARDDLEMNA